MRLILPVIIALMVLPSACGKKNKAQKAASANPETSLYSGGNFAMRWDHRPEAGQWTRAGMDAILTGHGGALISVVPGDYKRWCPAYAQNGPQKRAAFWVGLLSALAKHESTWNPVAVGGGGRWFGLVQIAPATARGYGCKATSGAALKNGADNLSCAIRIMTRTVVRDGVVAENWRGVAADWGPFHNERKRVDMMEWTAQQSYCQ